MRTWVYTWKSSDGLRHEGEMSAPSKDDVYAALRERGIRAIKVTERIVPVVRNGLKGLRKRDLFLLLAVALVLGSIVWWLFVRSVEPQPIVRDAEQVEKLAPDPMSKEVLMRLLAERKAKEEECRAALVKRVKEGTLSKEVANGIFKAMGLEELK